jgi:hypothetical protein
MDSIERTLENLASSEGRSNEKIPENPGRRLKDDQVRESYRTLAAS